LECTHNKGKSILKVQSILASGCSLELDATPYCDEEESDSYQQQMGVLRSAVELGRIDTKASSSMVASYSDVPRQGNLIALFHKFHCLKCFIGSNPFFDRSYIRINDEEEYDFTIFSLI
jgi:hypothetical protein